jgi:very-short-patch-repair endonuclease
MRRKTPIHVKELARELRNNQTSSEQELWSRIRNKQHGIRVIHFTNEETLNDLDNVLKRLIEYLAESLRSSASSSP